MNINMLTQRVFKAMAMLLLLSSTSLFAQNLIVNGDFEQTNFNYQSISDYTRITGGGVQEGQFIHETNSTGHGIGTGGWPTNLYGYGGSGYYLLFNGFGGNQNPTKAAWKQTVTVTTNTTYTFSAQVRNLSQGFLGYLPNPAIMRLKINNQQVGQDFQLPSNDNGWVEWTVTWPSGSATQAFIEIVDAYTGQSNTGDDFGIDHLSFVPNVVYSVDAVDDWDIQACQNTPIDIDVLNNDIILPNSNDATVTIVTQPSHGTATVLTNKKIRYTFSGGNYTTDQLKYQVANHGITDEAWVHINTSGLPQVANITAPGPICAGGVLGIPTPTVNPSGLPGQWEKSTNPNGTFQSFDPNNIPFSMNGNWVRYSVTNDCGTGSSNAVQITVTNGPSFTGQTPQIQPICAGGSLSLTAPAFNANGSQILSQGWVASPTATGDYTSFSLNNISAWYNGWYIRYMIEGTCGYVYSDPPRQLTVNVTPEITGTLQAPSAICDGGDLSVTAPTYDGTGTGSWEICQTPSGTYQPFNIQNVSVTYNNWYLHYKVSNDCGSDVSNAVQIHVNDVPTVNSISNIIPASVCAPYTLPSNTPGIQWNGGAQVGQGWQMQIGGQWGSVPNPIEYQHNGCSIRYYAENDCGPNYSNTVQLTVNAAPIVSNINAPAGVCEGDALNLTAPQVTWRHNDPSTCQGCWQVYLNGTWQDITGNSIPSISYNLYNGCTLRYKAHNGCDDSYSNEVSITVYSTQPIVLPDVTFCQEGYYHGVWCSQDGQVYGYDSLTPNNCTIHVSWMFHLSEDYNIHPQTETRCNEYYWPQTGITYYITDTYYDTVPNPNPVECDDVYILDLTVNHAPTVGQLESPDPIEVCASVGTLNVNEPEFNPNHDDYTTDWEVFYDGSWHGNFHPQSFNLGYGSYSLRFAVDNDCVGQPVTSNAVPFYVSEAPAISIVSGQLPSSVCKGFPLELPDVHVDWKNLSQSGSVSRWEISENGNSWVELTDLAMPMEHDWWIRYYAQNSCDDAVLGPVLVSVIEVEDETVNHEPECDSVMYNGVYYYESTVIDEVIDYPCPHTRHHQLVVNHSDRPETNPDLIEELTWCKDVYVWHGRTYYRSEQLQVDRWDTTNVWGCDSIRELRLSFGDANEIYNYNQHGCDIYTWDVNGTISRTYYYDENQPHVFDTVFVPGIGEDCDTYYYLDLAMGKTWEAWESPCDTIPLCKGDEYNGVSYVQSVNVYDTLAAVFTGCDSIVSRYLSVIQPIETEDSIVSCKPVLWISQGQSHWFEVDGEEFTAKLTSSETGCDSIVTIHFKLADNIEKAEDVTVCEPFVLPDGQIVNNGGPWTYIIPSLDDCDTTVYLNVTFIQMETILDYNEPFMACNSYPCPYNGITYGPGTYEIYHDTVFAENGCITSVRLLNLTVKDSEQMGNISGASNVYVASSLISGIYRYEIDMTGLTGPVTWSLSNTDWQIVEQGIDFCRVLVTTPVTASLTAHFNVEDCGEMERSFEINATFYGVEDLQNEVHVFPNPTRGTVTIEAEGMESIRLTNMMGQVLEMREGNLSDSAVLNLNGYTPSVYLIEIETVYGMVKKRLILCR